MAIIHPPSLPSFLQGFREDMGEGEGEREADTGTASLPLTSRNVQYDAYTRTVHIAPKTKVTVSLRQE